MWSYIHPKAYLRKEVEEAVVVETASNVSSMNVEFVQEGGTSQLNYFYEFSLIFHFNTANLHVGQSKYLLPRISSPVQCISYFLQRARRGFIHPRRQMGHSTLQGTRELAIPYTRFENCVDGCARVQFWRQQQSLRNRARILPSPRGGSALVQRDH
jgi:hypothetical protein